MNKHVSAVGVKLHRIWKNIQQKMSQYAMGQYIRTLNWNFCSKTCGLYSITSAVALCTLSGWRISSLTHHSFSEFLKHFLYALPLVFVPLEKAISAFCRYRQIINNQKLSLRHDKLLQSCEAISRTILYSLIQHHKQTAVIKTLTKQTLPLYHALYSPEIPVIWGSLKQYRLEWKWGKLKQNCRLERRSFIL